jgi:hypothetical protein
MDDVECDVEQAKSTHRRTSKPSNGSYGQSRVRRHLDMQEKWAAPREAAQLVFRHPDYFLVTTKLTEAD